MKNGWDGLGRKITVEPAGRARPHLCCSLVLLCSFVPGPQKALLKDHAPEAAKLFQDKKRLSSMLRGGGAAISSLSRSTRYTFKRGKDAMKATSKLGKRSD